jgi:G3E family GTPase
MNIKIDIISGFLGAGKTTLIKKLLEGDLKNERLAIVENEFGDVSIDGDLLKETNIDIKEISSGCICCSLQGDFKEAVKEIIKLYHPERILIEPSGVAKLSDIIKGCKSIEGIEVNNIFTVIDAMNFQSHLDNFGEFYKDQISNAKTIILGARKSKEDKLIECVSQGIRKINKGCSIITAPIEEIDSNDILAIARKDLEGKSESWIQLKKSLNAGYVSRVHHSQKADNIFNTWGVETSKYFSMFKLRDIFDEIMKSNEYGNILRGKGIVKIQNGDWVEFHYTPGRFKIKATTTQGIGKIAIIGEKIDKSKLNKLFTVER